MSLKKFSYDAWEGIQNISVQIHDFLFFKA